MNPITAVVKGTSQSITQAGKAVEAHVNSAIPKPSEAVYNLGMGIGPLLRNIANATDKPANNSQQTNKSNAALTSKKEMATLSGQFNTMINVLKDIRNIGMTQLRSDQQRLLEARRQMFLTKEANEEKGSLLRGNVASVGGKDEGGSLLSKLPDIAKIGLGGAALSLIWKFLLPDDMKEELKSKAVEFVIGKPGSKLLDENNNSLLGMIAKTVVTGLKEAPIETGIAALATAYLTGLLGVTMAIFKGGAFLTKVLAGKSVTPPIATTVPAAGAAAAKNPAVAGAGAVGPSPSSVQQAGSKTTPAGNMRPIDRVRMQQEVAANNKATAALEAETKALAAKYPDVAKGMSATAKVGNLLGVAGVGLTGYSSYEDYQEGKNWSGSLKAISAATGAGALAAGLTGIGAPAAAVLGITSLLTGLIGTITSTVEEGSSKPATPSSPASGAPTPSSSQPTSPTQLSSSSSFDERYKEMIGYTESRGNYNENSHRLGYLGKYQMGVLALETLGYLKAGSSKKVSSQGNQNIVLDDPSNWTNGWDKSKFLANQKEQDEAFKRMTQMNLNILKKAGAITAATSESDIAGLLTGAHLGGPGGVLKYLRGEGDASDVNGTSISKYIQYGRNVFQNQGSTYGDFAAAFKEAGRAAKAGTITPTSISGKDSRNAGTIAEITETLSDFMREIQQAPFNMVDQSSKTSVVNNNNDGGPVPAASVVDNIRTEVLGAAFPAR